MPTRQQRRAKSRAPVKRKRRGQATFVAVLVAVLLGGGAAAALFRARPPELKRGAIAGEHWHAKYAIEICGQRLQDFPTTEGEIHTHGDGQIHIHPNTPQFSNQNANLGRFFQSVETGIGRARGKGFILLPTGARYEDGDVCPGDTEAYNVEFLANGERIEGNPAEFVLHDGDDIVVRFGPEAKDDEAVNPLQAPTPAGASPVPTRRP